jgi:hypothetical protein
MLGTGVVIREFKRSPWESRLQPYAGRFSIRLGFRVLCEMFRIWRNPSLWTVTYILYNRTLRFTRRQPGYLELVGGRDTFGGTVSFLFGFQTEGEVVRGLVWHWSI